MAGPGGGAPRRSHTKSRKGCKTCKKRHIRCDENFPQCRNCTKHNCRCSYMDGPQPEARSSMSPQAADLLWNVDAEKDIERWRATGELPWPEMHFHPRVPITDFSTTELRLLHHIASVSTQMQRHDASKFTIWTDQVPVYVFVQPVAELLLRGRGDIVVRLLTPDARFLKIASSYDFVLHSVLALSATHLAWVTECQMTLQMACHHRGIAFRGLQEAIALFSRQNSDAVLAASIMLCLQVTDWRAWKSLMLGTSSVIDAMRQWRSASHFSEYMDERSTFSRLPGSSPSVEAQRNGEPSRRDQAALQRVYTSLQAVEAHAACRHEETRGLQQLMSFLRKLQTCLPLRSSAQQFEVLQPLRSWLLWLPVSLLDYGTRDAGELVVLAHLYAVALLVERLFPAVGAACFGSLSIGPIDEFTRTLTEMQATHVNPTFPNPLALIEVPLEMIAMSRPTMGRTQESNGLYSPIIIDHHAHGLGRLRLDTESDFGERAPNGTRSVSYGSDGARSTASPMIHELGANGVSQPSQTYYGSPLGHVDHHYHASNGGSFPGMGWMGTPTSSVDAEAEHRYKMTAITDFNTEELASPSLWPVQ